MRPKSGVLADAGEQDGVALYVYQENLCRHILHINIALLLLQLLSPHLSIPSTLDQHQPSSFIVCISDTPPLLSYIVYCLLGTHA